MTRNGEFLFDQASRALCERGGRLIVEVGAIRNRQGFTTDGHSTLRWPHDATVWSVDNDPKAVNLTRELTADRPTVMCVLADAIAFLRSFPVGIDLLYLDGPHPDRDGGRQWHYEAYRAATLNPRSVLLIDDTDVPRFGKAEFVVPAALSDGFQIVSSGRQTLLVR
ncbi:MAG: class I SAM-dependent methyltransferase [Phycisphaerae bacterium]|nr:class I SAM-dependent methyltransferase [Phycisphaerae bacterium]